MRTWTRHSPASASEADIQPSAVLDLKDIATYLVERSPLAAERVERRIWTLAELLVHFPASGRKLEQRPEVRVLPLGGYPYNIFYTVRDAELIVLHVRHQARQPVDPSDV